MVRATAGLPAKPRTCGLACLAVPAGFAGLDRDVGEKARIDGRRQKGSAIPVPDFRYKLLIY